MNDGYILLYKKLLKSEIWNKPPLYLKVFIFLLLKAQYQDYDGLQRGQVRTSIKELQEACSYYVGYRRIVPDRYEIRRALDFLSGKCERPHEGTANAHTNAHMIAHTNAHGDITATICNYNVYQLSKNYERPHDSPHEGPHEGTANANTNAILHSIENEKNELNNKINNTRARARNFVPPTVEEVRDFCLERGNNVDAETFVDFYQSKDWYIGKNKMKDWKAAVRTWERQREKGKREEGGKEVGKPNRGKDDKFSDINITEF